MNVLVSHSPGMIACLGQHTILLSPCMGCVHHLPRCTWVPPLLLFAEPPWPHRQGPGHWSPVAIVSAVSYCVQEAGSQPQPKPEPAAEQEIHEQQPPATEHPGPPLAVPGVIFPLAASAVPEEDDYDAEE